LTGKATTGGTIPGWQLDQLSATWWAPRAPGALTCEVAVNGTSALDFPVLEHPPVADSGRASRADVPTSSGSARLSILISDLPAGSAITDFSSLGSSPSVTVGGQTATDIYVSPNSKRLFLTILPTPLLAATSYDLVIDDGTNSATIPGAITYTDDVVAGLENLKASLAVMAEEAALVSVSVGATDVAATFCATMRSHVTSFQMAVMVVGATIGTDPAQTDAWNDMMINQAAFIRDTVNEAAASLDVPPIAVLYSTISGMDETPDYNPDRFLLAVTLLDQVIVTS
jgi:hypothetical protein